MDRRQRRAAIDAKRNIPQDPPGISDEDMQLARQFAGPEQGWLDSDERALRQQVDMERASGRTAHLY